MISSALPPALAAALDTCARGLSRNDAAKRSAAISRTYRSGGGSTEIRTESDALAYALARMPATYAAVTACLNAITEIVPDFLPASLLDCGAGPGTASWAATQAFDALHDLTLLDANPALRALALHLSDEIARPLRYELGDIFNSLAKTDFADLVIASYMIGEVSDARRATLADALWTKTQDTLLVVEPGTPAGTARILALRARLIAQGAHVIAPCPHDDTCPLASPDWCHFVRRLPRSRAHMALKSAEVPFEDEKFSYIALSRRPVAPRPSRVLAQPDVTKIAVTAKLCTPDGVEIETVPKRDKEAYRRFKKRDWGDAVFTGKPSP